MVCVRTNNLGMKGHIAQRYGELVKDLWSGTAKSIAPLKLRVSGHIHPHTHQDNEVLLDVHSVSYRVLCCV